MKNLLLTAVLLLAASFTFGQAIQKGNMIGVHVMTVELKPGVTMEQVVEYYNTKYFPAAAKHFGFKGFIGTGIRGSESIENKLMLIWHFKTEADRDKFFKADGSLSELGEKAFQQPEMQALDQELTKLATIKSEWADWVIK